MAARKDKGFLQRVTFLLLCYHYCYVKPTKLLWVLTIPEPVDSDLKEEPEHGTELLNTRGPVPTHCCDNSTAFLLKAIEAAFGLRSCSSKLRDILGYLLVFKRN